MRTMENDMRIMTADEVLARGSCPEYTKAQEHKLRLLICQWAESVLSLFEANCDDPRPRQAIETARRYVRGQASSEELAAAAKGADGACGLVGQGNATGAARVAVYAASRVINVAKAADAVAACAGRTAMHEIRDMADETEIETDADALDALAADAAAAWDTTWAKVRERQVDDVRRLLSSWPDA